MARLISSLAGGRVRLTAGFPALSAVHALTHGVHGIGDAVTVSVLADPDVVDVAAYRRFWPKLLLEDRPTAGEPPGARPARPAVRPRR